MCTSEYTIVLSYDNLLIFYNSLFERMQCNTTHSNCKIMLTVKKKRFFNMLFSQRSSCFIPLQGRPCYCISSTFIVKISLNVQALKSMHMRNAGRVETSTREIQKDVVFTISIFKPRESIKDVTALFHCRAGCVTAVLVPL